MFEYKSILRVCFKSSRIILMAKLDPDVMAALKKQVPKVAKKDIRVEVEKRFK